MAMFKMYMNVLFVLMVINVVGTVQIFDIRCEDGFINEEVNCEFEGLGTYRLIGLDDDVRTVVFSRLQDSTVILPRQIKTLRIELSSFDVMEICHHVISSQTVLVSIEDQDIEQLCVSKLFIRA